MPVYRPPTGPLPAYESPTKLCPYVAPSACIAGSLTWPIIGLLAHSLVLANTRFTHPVAPTLDCPALVCPLGIYNWTLLPSAPVCGLGTSPREFSNIEIMRSAARSESTVPYENLFVVEYIVCQRIGSGATRKRLSFPVRSGLRCIRCIPSSL